MHIVGQAVRVLALLALAVLGLAQPTNSQEPPSIAPPLRRDLHLARTFEEFEKAAEAVRLAYGDEDERYAEALLSAQTFAAVHWPRTSIERAVKKALGILERVNGPNSVPVARGMLVLARHYDFPAPWNEDRNGNRVKARALMERALAIYELNSESPEAEHIILQLAGLEKLAGNLATAEAHYKRALSIVEGRDGPDRERIRPALHGLATLYRLRKRLDDIEPLYKRIISISEASFGRDDAQTVRAWDVLADYYRIRCRDAEADAIAKRTSSHAKRVSAERARGLSKSLGEMEKAADGKHPLRGASPSMLASGYRRLGDYYRQAEQWADAEHAYHRAVAFLEKGTDLRDLWRAHAGLAESYLRRGRMEEAEPEYQRAVDAFRTFAAGRPWPLPLEVLDGFGEVYESTSRQDEAAAWKSQAAEGRERMKASRKCL